MAVGWRAYREQLLGLLPRGRAWPRSPDSVLGSLMAAIAPTFARLDELLFSLLKETVPSSCFFLLPEWEKAVGLPDDCSGLAPTIGDRRAAVVTKLVSAEGASIPDFVAVAARYGIAITVRDAGGIADAAQRAQYIADAAAIAQARGFPDPTADGRWKYVWWISLPTSARIRCFQVPQALPAPLCSFGNTHTAEIECRLQKLAPAHTLLVFVYHAA